MKYTKPHIWLDDFTDEGYEWAVPLLVLGQCFKLRFLLQLCPFCHRSCFVQSLRKLNYIDGG